MSDTSTTIDTLLTQAVRAIQFARGYAGNVQTGATYAGEIDLATLATAIQSYTDEALRHIAAAQEIIEGVQVVAQEVEA